MKNVMLFVVFYFKFYLLGGAFLSNGQNRPDFTDFNGEIREKIG